MQQIPWQLRRRIERYLPFIVERAKSWEGVTHRFAVTPTAVAFDGIHRELRRWAGTEVAAELLYDVREQCNVLRFSTAGNKYEMRIIPGRNDYDYKVV